MRPITLTTIVSNYATLPIFLKVTDELVSIGLLDSLRVIDRTPDDFGTEQIRSIIPVDGETGSRIVTLDKEELRLADPTAHVATGMTGYRYKMTGFKLQAGGASVYVITRGSVGSYIAVSPGGKSSGGVEIGLEKTRCFVRTGRGGGTPSDSLCSPGVVAGGRGWRAIKLNLTIDLKLLIELDTGATMTVQLRPEDAEFMVSISSPAGGLSDFVVSYLNPTNFQPRASVDRSYVSYFLKPPDPAAGIEFVSDIDLIYVDKKNWQRLVTEKAVPLVLGDPACCSALRRLGVLKESNTSKEVHTSFLARTRAISDRIDDLIFRKISVCMTDSKFKSKISENMGIPALVCGLQGRALQDPDVLAGYVELISNGPSGEAVINHASDVLAYFDALLNSTGSEAFLLELVEAMPKDKREFLFKVLNQRLS